MKRRLQKLSISEAEANSEDESFHEAETETVNMPNYDNRNEVDEEGAQKAAAQLRLEVDTGA